MPIDPLDEDTGDVRNALFEPLGFSKEESIRKAVIEGLADFDDEAVRSTLKQIADDGAESPRQKNHSYGGVTPDFVAERFPRGNP
ncbi:hypothetical protein [Halosimplex sp. TS25]|uniref:hypothetical protein n=1 Tax=Halosimplex rarum TaxID=3396619 RepID=UPI0039E96F28